MYASTTLRGARASSSSAAARAVPRVGGGAIEACDLTCRHRAGAPAALEGVSFRVEAGEHIGIAGPSGAGKSTLIKALLGLIPREAGSVTFDGIDLDRLDDRLLRRQIGIVGQGGKLFPGTLFDNIAAGAPITPAEAREAARKAGLEADIEALPRNCAATDSNKRNFGRPSPPYFEKEIGFRVVCELDGG